MGRTCIAPQSRVKSSRAILVPAPGASGGSSPCRAGRAPGSVKVHMTDGSLSASVRPRGAGPRGPAAPAVGVLIIDDHPVFLRAARDLIAATPGFEEVGEATSGTEGLALAASLRPDLVLLDVRMPGMDGVETARLLTATAPDAFVVLISLESPVAAGTARLVGVDAHVRKQDLSVRRLQDLWADRLAFARVRLSPATAACRR